MAWIYAELSLYHSNKPSDVNQMITATPRINIDYAEEYKDKLWRFFLKDNEYISGN